MAEVINRDAYTQLLRKVNPTFGTTPTQAAPAEAKAGKKTTAPLDTRPPAARNKPKPKHAAASQRVPKHLRGRGLISEKAMAAMSGPQDAAKARPWQGQKLPGWAAQTHGKHDAAAGKSATGKQMAAKKKPKHSKFAKRAGHNPPKPEFSTTPFGTFGGGRSPEQPDIDRLKRAESQMEIQQQIPKAPETTAKGFRGGKREEKI